MVNTADLDLRLDGVDELAVKTGGTFGATYEGNGRFDLSAGGHRSVAAGGEIQALSFVVDNLPAAAVVDAGDVTVVARVMGQDGPVVSMLGFEQALKVVNADRHTASVELFATNVGAKPLVDLENLEFRFTETDAGGVRSVCGADPYDGKFAVEP